MFEDLTVAEMSTLIAELPDEQFLALIDTVLGPPPGQAPYREDHVEGELALEFGERLLLRPASAGEGPQRREPQGQVGGHGRVLVVPVVGGEQIQLEVGTFIRSWPRTMLSPVGRPQIAPRR